MSVSIRQALTAAQRRDAETYCFEATKRSGSNLWLVGRFLPTARQKMFTSAYASMREIDDFVDDTFLAKPFLAREKERAAAVQKVEAWRHLCAEAIAPMPGAGSGSPVEMLDTAPIHQNVLDGLVDAWSGADLGPGPWNALADAMQRDIAETPFVTWSDFDAYCVGATVAPASIFLYVLSADLREEGARDRLPAPAVECARSMAIFCYLVHIARDLGKDAVTSPNLVTLPSDILNPLGLNRENLGQRLEDPDKGAVISLIAEIIGRASEFRGEAEAWQKRISETLGLKEKAALTALMTVYKSLHKAIEKQPEIVLQRDASKLKALKIRALEEAGIPL